MAPRTCPQWILRAHKYTALGRQNLVRADSSLRQYYLSERILQVKWQLSCKELNGLTLESTRTKYIPHQNRHTLPALHVRMDTCQK